MVNVMGDVDLSALIHSGHYPWWFAEGLCAIAAVVRRLEDWRLAAGDRWRLYVLCGVRRYACGLDWSSNVDRLEGTQRDPPVPQMRTYVSAQVGTRSP